MFVEDIRSTELKIGVFAPEFSERPIISLRYFQLGEAKSNHFYAITYTELFAIYAFITIYKQSVERKGFDS